MVKGSGGRAKRGAPGGCAPAHNDAEEAMEDARPEFADTTAELDAGTSDC
jgi:hypothetical protein